MNHKKYTMKELPESERPYEKLDKYGVQSLSDAELIAVLIKTGSKDKTSVALSTEILNLHPVYKGLIGLYFLSGNELKKISGIGNVKAAQLLCAAELSKRLTMQKKPQQERFDSPQMVADFFMQQMRTKETENTLVIFLDNKCRLIRYETLFVGTVSSCTANPREIMRKALQHDAACFILLHNHPSGDPTPSSSDISISERLKAAGELIGISLLDHIILGDCQYVSLRERGHI